MTFLKIDTVRLLLRPLTREDTAAVFSYRSDAETNRYQGFVPEKEEDVLDFFETRVCRLFNRAGTWYQLVIIKKETGNIIGDIGIHFIDRESKLVELGITLDKKVHRQGLATEALTALIRFLFLEMNKKQILARVDTENLRSVHLLKKLHFIEKIQSAEDSPNELVFVLDKTDWLKNC